MPFAGKGAFGGKAAVPAAQKGGLKPLFARDVSRSATAPTKGVIQQAKGAAKGAAESARTMARVGAVAAAGFDARRPTGLVNRPEGFKTAFSSSFKSAFGAHGLLAAKGSGRGAVVTKPLVARPTGGSIPLVAPKPLAARSMGIIQPLFSKPLVPRARTGDTMGAAPKPLAARLTAMIAPPGASKPLIAISGRAAAAVSRIVRPTTGRISGGAAAAVSQIVQPTAKVHPAKPASTVGPKGAGKGALGPKPLVARGAGKAAASCAQALANFKVNPITRHRGTVTLYLEKRRYGYVELDQKGLMPASVLQAGTENKVFVDWQSIATRDRFPALRKDMRVQLSLNKETVDGSTRICAANVTMPDGSPIAIQDEEDASKTFVGDWNLRYTGILKFFDPSRGFGKIQIDSGYDYYGEIVPEEIGVEAKEVNSDGYAPIHHKDVEVEFGIWKTERGQYKAFNMTLPGGVAMPYDPDA